MDTSSDPTALAVACCDLSQFTQYHPGGWIVVAYLKEKERVMKLMNHENSEVHKECPALYPEAIPQCQIMLASCRHSLYYIFSWRGEVL